MDSRNFHPFATLDTECLHKMYVKINNPNREFMLWENPTRELIIRDVDFIQKSSDDAKYEQQMFHF